MSSVEVQIELAHKASPRAKPTEEGYTHDWCVYVRGIDGCNIQYFVEKVVFQLHESFPKPRRVLKEPPYEISESGYAGFELPIEIYFRNKEEPKKVNYTYDLFLRIGDTCQNSQKEKLTFQNPNAEFKKKLLKAGGVIHEKVSDSPSRSLPLAFGDDKHSHKSSKSISRDGPGEKKKSSKMASVIPSKDKSLHSQQSSSNQGQSLSTSSSSHHSQISSYHEKSVNSSSNIPPPSSTHSQSPSDPFTDLFGTPIKTRPSPDPVHSKLKNNGGSGTSKTALSGLKSSSKKISSSDIKSSSGLITKSSEKEKKHKIIPNGGIVSSKDIKTEKDAKPSKEKSLKKRDESPKIKKEKHCKPTSDGRPTTPNLSASSSSKKSSSSLPSLTSVKKESADVGGNISKDSNLSSSKKRKRSLSPPSFLSSEIGDKKESGTLTKLSSKDGLTEKSHKEKSKKQKASSKDQVSTSATVGSNSNHKVKDVKKESSTSTTISLTNNENTGTTTLEIKSVKKEKTWDSEVKKSRSKEHKTDEVKSSRENVSKDINKVQVRDKEVVKEKEKEQPLLPEKKEKEKDKDKERSKDKSSKNRDREREKEKSKSRSKDKGNINENSISPKDKYSKIPKDKYIGTTLVNNNSNNNNNLSANVNSLRDSSSSPASIVSGSLTPGGGAFIGAPSSVSSLNGPIKTLMDEMDQESLPVSPLSSCDPPSPLTFGSKDKDSSSDGENNSYSHPSTVNKNLNPIKLSHYANHKPDITVREEPRPQIPRNVNPAEKSKNREFPPNIPSSKKRKETTSNAKPTEPTEPMNEPDGHRSPKPAISRGTPTTFDLEYINQLKVLHRKINDLRDRDVLQRIVDIIEETGLFNMTNTAFDFDLMQLDRNTVRKIRQCLIST